MELIRSNYETLKLTLQDDLDAYEPYLENPKEVSPPFIFGDARLVLVTPMRGALFRCRSFDS